jgi:hypothetical protein
MSSVSKRSLEDRIAAYYRTSTGHAKQVPSNSLWIPLYGSTTHVTWVGDQPHRFVKDPYLYFGEEKAKDLDNMGLYWNKDENRTVLKTTKLLDRGDRAWWSRSELKTKDGKDGKDLHLCAHCNRVAYIMPKCGGCAKDGVKIYYCSTEHQHAHWNEHKKECKKSKKNKKSKNNTK